MEHRVEMVLGDPTRPLRPGSSRARLVDHVDGHAQRGTARALAHPGLEHPELALLDGELGVAHVAVVALEPVEDPEQLACDLGEMSFKAASGKVLRIPATTSSPWAFTRKSP